MGIIKLSMTEEKMIFKAIWKTTPLYYLQRLKEDADLQDLLKCIRINRNNERLEIKELKGGIKE